jgi:hypothetical protein
VGEGTRLLCDYEVVRVMSEPMLPGPFNDQVPEMNLNEFIDAGFLQEVNRRFFHPLGLALSVKTHEDGTVTLHNIWDGRDDPEGFTFEGWTEADEARGQVIEDTMQRLLKLREDHLGFGIQPLHFDDAALGLIILETRGDQ